MNSFAAGQVWYLFQVFTKTTGMDEMERISANEQELGQYDFRGRTAGRRTDSLARYIYRASGIRLASVSLCLLAQDTEIQICMKHKTAMMKKL